MTRRSGESGQALVVFTVFLVVLLSFVALVIDGGMYLYERREMQGVADAAAMAAVRELPGSVGQASNVAAEYAEDQNPTARGELLAIEFAEANSQVTVSVGTTGNQSFGALLGMEAPDISAHATARVQMMGPRTGMLPMGFMRDSFEIGENYSIMFTNNATGNRGALAPGMLPDCSEARGGNNFRDLIKGEAYGGVDACATPIAETIDTEPGQMTGPVRGGFDARIGSNSQEFEEVFELDPTTGLYSVLDPESPRIGIVPIIENLDGSDEWPHGRSTPIRILGYMMVYIGNTDRPGNPPYTDNGSRVWVTPVQAILPKDFPDGDFIDYDDDLPAPVVFRLVD